MREYLFRGIILHPTIILNGWFYGDLIHFADGLVAIRQQETGEIQHVISETIGQFTGLLDKNGTQVFEGDKARIAQTTCNFEIHALVVYEDSRFLLKSLNTGTAWDIEAIEFEVIGNIHDNE